MRILRVHYREHSFYAALTSGEKGVELTCLQPELGISSPLPLTEVALLPLVAPSKIICVGLNFREHAAEMSMPLPERPAFFLKPPSALIGNGQTILLPRHAGRIDYEAELAVIIGLGGRGISPAEAPAHIFGYACANDVTARDEQKGEIMFGRCKGYDTFCPVGPWIETTPPAPDAAVRTVINGEIRQQGRLSDMILSPAELISHISGVMTLAPGDVILTGTPRGVGPLRAGDEVRIEIDGVGLLSNSVDWDVAGMPPPEDGGLIQ